MPQAIGIFLAGGTVVGGGAAFGGLAIVGASAAATLAVQIGTMVVISAVSRKLAERGTRRTSDSQGNNQRELTVRATDAYEPFVYGRAMVAGLTIYNNAVTAPGSFFPTSKPNNRYIHLVRWTGHRVNCLEYFRLDDRVLHPSSDAVLWNPVTYAGSGAVQSGALAGDVVGAFPTRFRWYDGAQTSADYWLNQWAWNTDWPVSRIGKERAYGLLEIAQVEEPSVTDKVYAQGFPSNIFAYVHGKSVFDPRRWSLNGDPQFLSPGSWWYQRVVEPFPMSGALTSMPTSGYVSGVGGLTDKAIRVSGSRVDFFSELLPVVVFSGSQQTFTAVWRARQTSGSAVNYPSVVFYTDTGSELNNIGPISDATGWSIGTYHYPTYAGAAFPSVWSTFLWTIGSGMNGSIPTSARFMRIGVLACYDAASVVEIQEMRLNWQAPSAQHVTISSEYEWRDNPALCAANYLMDESFGFGRESRLPVNASRYALNDDPCFRRDNTMNIMSYWTVNATSPMAPTASLSLGEIGAPAGRRALVLVASAGSVGDPGIRVYGNPFPVDPSGIYTASFQARGTGNRSPTVTLECLTADLSTAVGEFAVTPSPAPFPSAWSSYVTTVGSGASTIPSSARFMRFKIYNPFSYTSGGGATTQWFQEVVVQAASYIRRTIEPWEQIDWSSVSSAASYCDELVSTPSGTQARFTCNGQGDTGRSYRDNLKDILSSGNLRVSYTQSGWRFFGGWQQPSVVLNAADLLGELQVRGTAETRDRYNTVRASIYDRYVDHKLIPVARVTAPEYVARDNSTQLFEDIELPYTNDWYAAQRVMFGVLDQGDNQLVVKGTAGGRAFRLQVGRQFGIKLDVLSWSPKYFALTEASYHERGVAFTAREDFSGSYTDPTSAEYVPRSGAVVSSGTTYVPQVGSVTVTPRPDAIALRWANPPNRAFEWIDIWRATTNAYSGSTLAKSVRADEWTDQRGVGDNNYVWYYWFQARDFAGQVSSIYPGLTTSFYGSPLVQVANDPEYVFLEEFNYQSLDQFEARWERADAPYPAGISFPQSGNVIGGRVLAANSTQAWYSSRVRIPFDAGALYQMTVGVTQIASRDAQNYTFAGFTAYRADGTTSVNVNSDAGLGSQHYFVLNGFRESDIATSYGLWREFTGHVRGTMPWPLSGTVYSGNYNHTADPNNAARMHDLTRYVSPMFLLNYAAGTGLAAIDYVKVRKIRLGTQLVYDPTMTLETNWITNNGSSFGGSTALQVESLAQYVKTSVFGRYNVIKIIPTSWGTGTAGDAAEKINYSSHRQLFSMSTTSDATFRWFASVYVANQPATVDIRPIFMFYSASGTVMARVFPLGSVSVISGTGGKAPSGVWTDIGLTAVVRVNCLGLTYPAWVSAGVHMTGSADMYISQMDAFVL